MTPQIEERMNAGLLDFSGPKTTECHNHRLNTANQPNLSSASIFCCIGTGLIM